MTRRLLVVEGSAAMRRTLGNHLRGAGYAIDDTAELSVAVGRLERRFGAFSGDIDAVVLGWPAGSDAEVQPVLDRLERSDLADLPVVVMSTDLRAATRAWVASRDRTAMLAWKRFKEIDALLAGLLPPAAMAGGFGAPDGRDRASGDPGSTPSGVSDSPSVAKVPPAKFDNGDIQLLVVDDSATIRRSLEDLFRLHGYRVMTASGPEDALGIARRETIDVAIVDFYLEDGTGDDVCRELVADAATGDVVCAVLTGTYSDHIIRRSLRAGALECLFKSESSELLLNRIDALSRFVRQNRRIERERRLLERVFDVVAGPAVVLDAEGDVRLVSAEALELLGHDRPAALIGRGASAMLADRPVPPADGELHRVPFRLADGSRRLLLAERRPLPDDDLDASADGGSVLQFALAEQLVTDPEPEPRAAVSRPAPRQAVIADLAATAPGLFTLLDRCLDGREPIDAEASLLLVRARLAGLAEPDGGDLHEHPELVRALTPRVLQLYRRADHVASLGDGLYGLLLRHRDAPQSWLLVRKLMQLINVALQADGGPRLSSHGVLKNLGDWHGDSEALLSQCLAALAKVETLGPDRALLLGPKRLLVVYPTAS